MKLEQRMAAFSNSDLYVVITQRFCDGRRALDVLEAVLEAGVRVVQMREKDLPVRELYAMGVQFRERTKQAGALLIVDDRLDIAQAVGADGVHLGLQDLPVPAARRVAPDMIIGASSHNAHEALEAQRQGADYVNIGPIFSTQTKDVPTGAVGPELIGQLAPQLSVPFTVMGGIKAHNIDQVVAQGARHIAVVTAVTAAADPKAAAKELRARILAESNG